MPFLPEIYSEDGVIITNKHHFECVQPGHGHGITLYTYMTIKEAGIKKGGQIQGRIQLPDKESIDDKSEARTAAANYCYTVYNFLLIVPSLRNAVDIVL